MEKYYDIGYAVVSLIFLSNAAGFIFAAFVSQPLYSRIGRSQTILVGISLLGIASMTLSFAPPWGVVVFSYFLTGAGMALVWIFLFALGVYTYQRHKLTHDFLRFLPNVMYFVRILPTAPRYLVMSMVGFLLVQRVFGMS